MQKEISETAIEIKRTSWRQIREIVGNPSLPDLEKLRQCYQISAIYAALTGDDSLFPPAIRDEHSKMIAWLKVNGEKIEKRKAALEKDTASGQPMFGE